jgi:acetyl esterase/lipase
MPGLDYFFARRAILPFLRFFFDYVAWPYAYFHMNNRTFVRYASDGRPCHEGLIVDREFKYGDHPYEVLDIISPTGENVVHRGTMIYAHGGGWVCVNRELLMQSITPFVRAGFTIYVIDYPLAPQSKFPVPLISMLRAISWVKHRTGQSSITLLGDSAGGNLVTMAGAFLENPRLLRRLGRHYGRNDIAHWDYPSISKIVSVYGVLDQTAHKEMGVKADGRLKAFPFHVRFFYEANVSLLNFCFYCYKTGPADAGSKGTGNGRPEAGAGQGLWDAVTVGDLLRAGDIHSFPSTLVVCGREDPLAQGAKLVHRLLEENSSTRSQCELFLCHGLHSFHGMPIHLTLGRWERESLVATKRIVSYLTDGEVQVQVSSERVKEIGFDWIFLLYMAGAISLLVCIPIIVSVGIYGAYRYYQ